MRWLALALGGALALAFFLDQTLHRARLDQFAQHMDRDLPGAAGELAAGAGHHCPSAAPDDEYLRLAEALFAVERLATSRTESIVERIVTRAVLLLGMEPPDLSIGEGQIRISTLKKALADIPPAAWGGRKTGRTAVSQLLEPCRAQAIGAMIIRHHVKARPGADGLLPRAEVQRVATFWNGQKRTPDADAYLAGLRYRELVYQTFLALRFRSARRPGDEGRISAY